MVPQCWFDVEKIKACHKKMETFFRDVEEWRWYFQIPSCSFYFGMLPCAGLGYPLFIAGWLRSPVNLLPMIGYPSASITLNTEGPSDFRLTLEDASSNGPGHFRMILWSQLTSTRDSWPSFPWIHCTCWTTYMLQVLYPCGTPKIGHPVKSSLHILLVVVIYIYILIYYIRIYIYTFILYSYDHIVWSATRHPALRSPFVPFASLKIISSSFGIAPCPWRMARLGIPGFQWGKMELSPLETAGHLWKLGMMKSWELTEEDRAQTRGYRDISSSVWNCKHQWTPQDRTDFYFNAFFRKGTDLACESWM
jgi:hypothetical protein